ncbi:MAG: peptidylprolyl isomerase [Planctomycetota bacterium]
MAEAPAGAAGAAEVRLYPAPGLDGAPASDPIATAPIELGRVDFAALFPQLWQRDGRTFDLYYAQLVIGGEEVGAPLVIQPLVTPVRAKSSGQGVVWPPSPAVFTGLRVYPDQHVLLETTSGPIEVKLRPDHAPNTAWNFRTLAEGGFYTDILFHRIIAMIPGRGPFVIQVGDPTGTGRGGPGYQFDLERSILPHDFGVISMARSGDPDSNGSQVFLCLSRPGTQALDGNYTTFGYAVSGAAAIVEISASPVGPGDRPVGENLPKIESARLVDAPVYSQTPAPVTRPEAGAER